MSWKIDSFYLNRFFCVYNICTWPSWWGMTKPMNENACKVKQNLNINVIRCFAPKRNVIRCWVYLKQKLNEKLHIQSFMVYIILILSINTSKKRQDVLSRKRETRLPKKRETSCSTVFLHLEKSKNRILLS